MKPNQTIIACLFVIALSISFSACKKNTNNSAADEDSLATLSASAMTSESIYDDSFDIASQGSEQSSISVSSISGIPAAAVNDITHSLAQITFTGTLGATVTLVPADINVFPKTMTIDYGTGITSTTGILRKGQIIVYLTGKARAAGTIITITYKNYSVNGYTLGGTYTLTPQVISGGGVNYTSTISNGTITFPDGKVSTYTGTETFTQTGGTTTPGIVDDTYSITGGFTYNNSTGGTLTGAIVTPLIKPADCKNITSGTMTFTNQSLTAILDFGSGTCDNLATVKVGSTTKTITLPR